ncbi:MAG TPA: hypothetical protein VEC37_09150 [Bacillota bacterium]|nr:hypothetical protein [Bacillota bacterium]
MFAFIITAVKIYFTVLGVCLVLWILFWVFLMLYFYFAPGPPKPKITYAEFPIRLEYENHGERVVINDTLQCLYDGIGGGGSTRGKYHKWTWRLSSGNKRLMLLKLDESREICYPIGDVAYYMGYGWSEPVFYGADLFDWSTGSRHTVDTTELWKQYQIRIISWDKIVPLQQIPVQMK